MRILLVDDHLVARGGMARLLGGAIPALEIHEAKDAVSALAVYRQRRFDIVVIDIGLPGADGFSLLQGLFAEDDHVRALMFSVHEETGYVGRALRLGARGYVSKCAPAEEFIEAVKAVAAGSRYVQKELAIKLALAQDTAEVDLTPREEEILRMLASGKNLREIAVECQRTYKHISNTVINIKAKLGIRSSVELLRKSIIERPRRSEDA